MKSENAKFLSLIEVGIALTGEKSFEKILELILQKGMEIANADAASIYLIEKVKTGSESNPTQVSHLRFLKTANRTRGTRLRDRILDLNRESLAGFVAIEGRPLRIADAYELPADVPYKFEKKYDIDSKYRSKSMMVLPLKSAEGQVLGVLQIINRVDDSFDWEMGQEPGETEVCEFADEDEHLLTALASQAAVALNNLKLNREIKNLFESFVKASVMAIESRDPSTSGHSDRVALLSVETALILNRVEVGKFRETTFSNQQIRELRYASLLHDFGKIGVREDVLSKEKKLFPHELEALLLRLESARSAYQAEAWKNLSHSLLEKIECGCPLHQLQSQKKEVESDLLVFEQKLTLLQKNVLTANEPMIMASDLDIKKVIGQIDELSTNLGQKLLPDDVRLRLSIPKGSLSDSERKEIESHVTHTFRFLSEIAWTEELSNVPEIAHAHHEKLDGTGYPRGLKDVNIPMQAKIMAIADIYDALTARDRPYKKALDTERALNILNYEARNNKVDKELLQLFIEAKVWTCLHETSPLKKAG